MSPTMSAGLLQYVLDPLNPGQYIPENDPRYSVVTAWMSAAKEDSITRANALKKFNSAMADWQTNARHCDDLGIPHPPLPAIPVVENDQVVAESDGSYAMHTTFSPVAQYPSPLLPALAAAASVDIGQNSPARQPTAPSPDVAALTARVDALLALVQQLLGGQAKTA